MSDVMQDYTDNMPEPIDPVFVAIDGYFKLYQEKYPDKDEFIRAVTHSRHSIPILTKRFTQRSHWDYFNLRFFDET